MIFPKVQKRFGRLASKDKISKATVKVVGAALLAAGMAVSTPADVRADVGLLPTSQAHSLAGGVITLPLAPRLIITDGTTTLANHYSHSSHASHTSHGSHCSGYSYC
jgi:hypothetical protein